MKLFDFFCDYLVMIAEQSLSNTSRRSCFQPDVRKLKVLQKKEDENDEKDC